MPDQTSSRTSLGAAFLLLLIASVVLTPLGVFVFDVVAAVTGGGQPPRVLVAPDPLSDAVSATAAEFRVDESGAATYAVPLYTVPGTAGVKPSVSLVYSSQGGYGPIGKGWSLSGLSSIARCRATREAGDFIGAATPDGAPRPINFSATDRFCLDGQRLIPSTATCPSQGGMSGVALATEIDTFARVCAYTASGSTTGPAFFTVERKDGSLGWYGDRDSASGANRPDGYLEATSPLNPGAAIVWAQTRLQDSTGNTIDYLYRENPAGAGTGEQVIGEIRYTGKVALPGQSSGARAPFAKLQFNYSTRPAAQWSRGYAAGGITTQSQRLESITSCASAGAGCPTAEQVRHMLLTYDTSASGSGLDTLIGLQECRDDSAAVCSSPTAFHWSVARNEFITSEEPASTLGNWLSPLRGMKWGDVDGDGRPDMVYLLEGEYGDCPTEAIYVAFSSLDASNRQTFTNYWKRLCTPAELLPERGDGAWHLVDYNGDGRDDLMISGPAGQGWRIHPSLGRDGHASKVFDDGQNLLAGLSPALTSDQAEDRQPQLADLNGDGLLDVLYPVGSQLAARLMERQGAGFGFGSERAVVLQGASVGCGGANTTCTYWFEPTSFLGVNQLFDLNADGSSDVLVQVNRNVTRQPLPGCQPEPGLPCTPTTTQDVAIWPHVVTDIGPTQITLTAYGSSQPLIPGSQAGDFNGDGLTDFLTVNTSTNTVLYTLNTGTGFAGWTNLGTVPNAKHLKVADANGDGRSDLLYPDVVGSNKSFVARLALPQGGFAPQSNLPGGNAVHCPGSACNVDEYMSLFGDYDADGALEHVRFKPNDSHAGIRVSRAGGPSQFRPRDVITRIVNGLGAQTELTYAALTNAGVHRRDAGARNATNWGRGSPVSDVAMSQYVVARAASTSPSGGDANAKATVHYRYAGAKVQAGGRGFLGFREIATIDVNHSGGHVVATTTYAQNFPFVGVPVQTTKAAVLGQAYIAPSCVNGIVNETCYATPGQAHPALGGSWFSQQMQSWEMAPATLASQAPIHLRTMGTEESLRDPYTGEQTSKVATAFTYGSHGNVTQTVVDTYTGASTLAATQITQNTYSDDAARWRLGRLTASTVTHRRPGQPDIVRTTGFGYAMSGAATGLLTEERIQPGGTADLASTTSYLLDDFGNRVQSTTCAAPASNCSLSGFVFQPSSLDAVKRYSRVEYDADGRFPVATYEPFWSEGGGVEVQTSRVLQRNVFGEASETLDANNVRAVSVAGTLGRPYFSWAQTAPDATPGNGGATRLTTYRWCSGSGAVACPAGATFREQVSATASPRQWTYFDALARPVMKAVETFNANVAGQDVSAVCTEYDVAGRARRTSTPFFLSGTGGMDGPSDVAGACSSASRAWTTTSYDILGRPTAVLAADGSQFTSSYAGLVTTTRDARDNPSTQTRNGKGEVIATQDAAGFVTQFAYNAAGNLISVSRNAGAGTIANTFGYDVLGRKTLQVDPDTGTTTFQYNALGELIAQSDNGGYRTEHEIDARGRVWRITAKLPDGSVESQRVSVFDTAPGGMGQLDSETVTGHYAAWSGQTDLGLGYRRDVVYDAMGRVTNTVTTVDDQGFTGWIGYDSLGRPWKAQDASGAWVKTQYGSRGVVATCASTFEDQDPDCGSGPDTYQRTLATDAWGNVVREVRAGNSALEVRRQYHALSGRIAEICAGNAACNLMKEAYVWDAAGNLASHQKEGRYLEGFTYDSLNRVTEGRLTMANGVTVNQVMLANAYDALGNVCSRNGVGYGYPGADGCVGAVPMAQAASIPSLASAVLPRYQRMAQPVTQRPQGAALNRGQMQAPEGRYRRYSEDRPSWDDEADAWSLGFENGTGPAGWQRRPSRTGGRPSASAALPTATRQLATLTATAVTQAAVSSVASSPHAVNQVGSGTSASFYYYDDRGNQTLRDAPGTGSDRTIRYTADGKAHEIQLGSGQTTRFWYGPDGQRYKRTDGTTTTYYVGGVEVVVQNGVSTARRYVAGVALQTVVDGAVQATRYLFHDHLGSLVRIANVDGSVAESLDYTAFGDRRAYGNPGGTGSASVYTPRGFTGHEMVDGAQVIHMNGRIYDPQLGRFLQPDPVIQEPTNAQSWNAYTYVFNNPLAYTDPSGMMSERAWNNVWRAAALVVSIISMGATSWHMGISTQAGMTAAAAGGFFAGYAATGTLKSAVIGAFSAAITAGIAGSTMNGYEQMAAQAVTGGVVESLQGGSFGHGFVAAGLTTYFMPQVGGYSAPVRTALGALIGGTISAVTGGKFANGAISGAVQGAMMKARPEANHYSKKGGKSRGIDWTGASREERRLLSNPATRTEGLRLMNSRLGLLVQNEMISYVDELGPLTPLGRADAQELEGYIIFYKNAFDGSNSFMKLTSIMEHEYSHWLDWRFKLPGYNNANLSEANAYEYQMNSPTFGKLSPETQAWITSMQEYYRAEYRLETTGFHACRRLEDC
nr:FG-GAP-like repeat-containing protein [uncultured Pseudoxanthomonas sp.]